MFLCQPLLEVFAGRGIEDIDAFLRVPSWSDIRDPFSIPSMEKPQLASSPPSGIASALPSLAIMWSARLCGVTLARYAQMRFALRILLHIIPMAETPIREIGTTWIRVKIRRLMLAAMLLKHPEP
jgi:hypothetical protein